MKTLFCNLNLFYGFTEKNITKYANFCLSLEWPNPLKLLLCQSVSVAKKEQ